MALGNPTIHYFSLDIEGAELMVSDNKSITYIQGWPKRWTPGSVNMRRKNCVLLPAASRTTQISHLIFKETEVNLLGQA